MIITCPWCGPRGSEEFTYRGDGSIARPEISNTSVELANSYVFDRENIAGDHSEIWQHSSGCRSHLLVMRNTLTHEIKSSELLGPYATRKKSASNKKGSRK
jgi:heterotetrameric sarcosine oxidase delta subunit